MTRNKGHNLIYSGILKEEGVTIDEAIDSDMAIKIDKTMLQRDMMIELQGGIEEGENINHQG